MKLAQIRVDSAGWKTCRIKDISIRPGTKDGYWEIKIRRNDGRVVAGILTLRDIFLGEHVRRRRVPPDEYPL